MSIPMSEEAQAKSLKHRREHYLKMMKDKMSQESIEQFNKYSLEHPLTSMKVPMSQEAIERCKKHRREHPELRRWECIKRKHGITREQYEIMFKTQNGVCAICKQPSEKPLEIDHDHVTLKIRGLLCGSCNKMLANAKDSEKKLIAGAEYLKNIQYKL